MGFFASCAKLHIVFFFFFFFFSFLLETLPKQRKKMELRATSEKVPYLLEFQIKYQKNQKSNKNHQKIIIHKNKKKCQMQKNYKNPNNRKSKSLLTTNPNEYGMPIFS